MEQLFNLGFEILVKAAEFPQSVALRAPGQEMTYDQLRTRIIRYALQLRHRGISRSSCVALDTNRMPEGIALPLALALLGSRWVRLTPEARWDALGVTHILALTAPQGVALRNFHIVDDSWVLPPPGVDLSKPVGFEGYASPDDIALFSQSSGTTGQPKFIAKSYSKVWILAEQRFSEDFFAVYSGFPPLSGIGFHVSIEMLLRGGTVIVGCSDVQQVNALGAQRVIASPAQIESLCRNLEGLSPRIPLLSAAGAMVSPPLIRRWLQFFERIGVLYGSQEAWRGGSAFFTDVPPSEAVAYVSDSDVKIEIVDPDDLPCPADTIGIVRIRTPEMVEEYVAAPEATAEAFRNGWFYPGDLGSLSVDGKLRIHGRIKDQFNLGGVKVNGADIDATASAASGVQAAVSFTRPVDGALDDLCVLAVLAPGMSPEVAAEQIRTCCRSIRGPELIPKFVFFADHVPINENGKPVRETALEISATLPAY